MSPFIDLPGGGWAHIKMAKRPRRRCAFCATGFEERLCDFPVGPGERTCDKVMCNRCSTRIAVEVDYCPKHKDQSPQQSLPYQPH
jgi:hypothetical protein